MGGYTMKRLSVNLVMTFFVIFSMIFGREKVATEHTRAIKTLNNSNENSLLSRPASNDSGVDRDQIILYSEDFEGDHGWVGESGWSLTTDNFNSETSSWNSPNDETTLGGVWKLVSPVISIPDVGENDVVQFGFHIFGDMPDTDGDADGYLEDYYSVSIMDPTALAWHSDGDVLVCSDEEVGGYLDSWLQFLDLPELVVENGMTLSADMQWGIESPDGAEGAIGGSCTDGWDAANVRISTDGGATWELLNGSDPYDFDCGYGWIWNDAEYEAGGAKSNLSPGWGGQADMHNVTFDLSAYAGQSAIIRFAFGSDPAYCTTDDVSLTGFMVDNIEIGNAFTCDGSDMCGATANGAVWVDQFYDYVDDTRPGGLGFWEEYMPGYPFNGNVFMDITNFAGGDIIVRFQSRYDENDDGGSGSGLFVDDFKVYMEAPAGPAPSGLVAEGLDGQVDLNWIDMNQSGTFDYSYDNDSFSNGISLTEGTGYAGSSFEIVGASTVNSVDVFNNNGVSVTTTLAAFGTFGSFFDVEPLFTQEITLEDGWNNIIVDGWNFNNKYIIAMEISDAIAIAIDESVSPSSNSYILFGAWDPWSETGPPAGLSDGEWGIRANITQEGANATYNVYRDGNQIANGLDQNNYSDEGLDNNVTYSYQLSATYASGDESELSVAVEATPQSNSVYELSYDDGSAEAGVNAGSGNFMAVRYATSGPNQNTVRAKWYQNEDGGAFYLKVFEDNGGLPGSEVFSTIRTGGIVGWNTYDLSDEGLLLSGDFWIGVKEFSSTRPFGLDIDSNSGNSYYSADGTTWSDISGLGEAGNLMLRVFLDEGDGGGGGDCTLGDANGDGGIDVLDIVVIVNYILTGSDVDQCAADANEDGGIDVLDIVTIVNNILGG